MGSYLSRYSRKDPRRGSSAPKRNGRRSSSPQNKKKYKSEIDEMPLLERVESKMVVMCAAPKCKWTLTGCEEPSDHEVWTRYYQLRGKTDQEIQTILTDFKQRGISHMDQQVKSRWARNMCMDRPKDIRLFVKSFPDPEDLVLERRNCKQMRVVIMNKLRNVFHVDDKLQDVSSKKHRLLSPDEMQVMIREIDHLFFDGSLLPYLSPLQIVVEKKDAKGVDGLAHTEHRKDGTIVMTFYPKSFKSYKEMATIYTALEGLLVVTQHELVHAIIERMDVRDSGDHDGRFLSFAQVLFGHGAVVSYWTDTPYGPDEIRDRDPISIKLEEPDWIRSIEPQKDQKLLDAHRRVVIQTANILPRQWAKRDSGGKVVPTLNLVRDDFIRVGQILFREYNLNPHEWDGLIHWEFACGSERWSCAPVVLYCHFNRQDGLMVAPIRAYVEVLLFHRSFARSTVEMADPFTRMMETTMLHCTMLKKHGKRYMDFVRRPSENEEMSQEFTQLARTTFGHDPRVSLRFASFFEFSLVL